MEEYKNKLNPIQYEYIYHVCKRLAPHLDEFDSYIKPEKKNIIILRCLIDSFFEMDNFLDFVKRNSLIDMIDVPASENEKGLNKTRIEVSDDFELIKKAFLSFKSLFLVDRKHLWNTILYAI